MANIFTNMYEGFARTVASYIQDALGVKYGILGNYYSGDHRPQLRRREGQKDDNIFQNWVGLTVDRSTSRLFRGGVEFQLPDNATQQQEYIDTVWKLNKKEIFLYQVGLYGANYGTCYIEIVPEQKDDPITGEQLYYPRLVALYPPVIRIITDPHDVEAIWEYRIEYTVTSNGQEIAYRKIVRRMDADEGIEQADGSMVSGNWIITVEIKRGSAQWEMVSSIVWMYDFPPIVHWKNLPSLNSVYGSSEIEDAINIQDASNFSTSNNMKIVKHHAARQPVFIGVSAAEVQKIDSSPDSAIAIPNKDARAEILDGESDLVAARAIALDLRQSIFDVAREIDITSVTDKVGALTNFGLHVLYTDALDKNDTKRQLYGDALSEVNRRILVMAGYAAEASDPGVVVWGDPMPSSISEDMQADKMALDMKIVDRETVYRRYQKRYGTEWEEIKERLEDEQNERQENQERIFGTRQPAEPGGFGQGGVQRGERQGPADRDDEERR